ncbi:hypothetical protein [Oceanobacillus massiliensis]|uniref:hypothetical protein n=1 Tax=Oceanobacillus massiliensis TaxID=1465765 RepID=UPI003018BD1C
MRIEMDIYEKDNLLSTIGNLMMMKAFHDVGVDTDKFPRDYYSDVHYGNGTDSHTILEIGCEELYEEVHLFSYATDEEINEKVGAEFNAIYENALLICDSRLKAFLTNSESDCINEIEKDLEDYFLLETKLTELDNGIIIEFESHYFIEQIAVALTKLYIKVKDFNSGRTSHENADNSK